MFSNRKGVFFTSYVGSRTVFMSYCCVKRFRKIVINLLADEFYCIA